MTRVEDGQELIRREGGQPVLLVLPSTFGERESCHALGELLDVEVGRGGAREGVVREAARPKGAKKMRRKAVGRGETQVAELQSGGDGDRRRGDGKELRPGEVLLGPELNSLARVVVEDGKLFERREMTGHCRHVLVALPLPIVLERNHG